MMTFKGRKMVRQQVLLASGERGKLFACLALLALIGVFVLEVSYPGTIGSIVSLARREFAALVDGIGDIIDSLIELTRAISNW